MIWTTIRVEYHGIFLRLKHLQIHIQLQCFMFLKYFTKQLNICHCVMHYSFGKQNVDYAHYAIIMIARFKYQNIKTLHKNDNVRPVCQSYNVVRQSTEDASMIIAIFLIQ